MASGSRPLRSHFCTTRATPRASDRIGISATSGKSRRELRQVERQPGAHDDRVGAALAGLAHVGGVVGHRAHHVDRDHAAAGRER